MKMNEFIIRNGIQIKLNKKDFNLLNKKMWNCPSCNKRRKVINKDYILETNLRYVTSVESVISKNEATDLILICKTCLTTWKTDFPESYHEILKLPSAKKLLEVC